MTNRNAILVVDQNDVDPDAPEKINVKGYALLAAHEIQQAFDILSHQNMHLAAIVVDIGLPYFPLKSFLSACHGSPAYHMIPLIVTADKSFKMYEQECLLLGAWDFLLKPCPNELLSLRVENAIEHSALSVVDELQHLVDFDAVSGIYNKQHFFAATRKMLDENPEKTFVMVHFDIEKFRLVNSFFGVEEGDKLIRYIAGQFSDIGRVTLLFSYGHISADVFACCFAFSSRKQLADMARNIRTRFSSYPLTFSLLPVFGFVVITDNMTDINILFDEATLAGKSCKGNYMQNFAFYDESMSAKAVREQYLVNSMASALEREEFVIYLQPKYDLRTNTIGGAEALVRWNHPKRGMIAPGEFIPSFERNGFITRLDYYVWDHTCAILRRWRDEGKKVLPVSVNISRVDLYDPKLVDKICGLVRKYRIPPELLQLELTESAYTRSPEIIKEMMCGLREKGFTVLMDDFGNGYSSLNALKDIVVDILKIDMNFFTVCDIPGRSENILDSVVRMAKWLNMPVIAEGVETADQVNFLRSIGCEYVQGYYFAKPMPVAEYEKLMAAGETGSQVPSTQGDVSPDILWSATSQLETLFSNIVLAMALYEFDGESVEILRVNGAYNKMLGYTDLNDVSHEFMDSIAPEDRLRLLGAFQKAVQLHSASECEYRRMTEDDTTMWVKAELKFIRMVGSKAVIIGGLTDITSQKKIELELQKYRAALATPNALRARLC